MTCERVAIQCPEKRAVEAIYRDFRASAVRYKWEKVGVYLPSVAFLLMR